MEIEVNKPFQFKGQQVTKFVIRPFAFHELVAVADEASGQAKKGQSAKALIRSKLIQRRTTMMLADGKTSPLEPLTLLSMPRPVASILLKFFDTEGDTPEGETEEQKAARIATGAKILQDGDGLNEPVLVKLGQPIQTAGESEISELEFMAKTYGDIENVLAADGNLEQAMALIRYVAKPAGMLALPSWGAEAISVADGLFIMSDILPRFLE